MSVDLNTILQPKHFFSLKEAFISQLYMDCEYVWEVLARLEEHVARLVGKTNDIRGDVRVGAYINNRGIYIGEGAIIEPGAFIEGPAYIGEEVIVRHGAYVRQNVILLRGSILGHASEAKNALFLPQAHAPHFNYVGDSILGHRVNLGAGTKLSNLTMVSEKDPQTHQRPNLRLVVDGQEVDTGLAKLGAILGDDVQTGCNSVMNPGCLIGPRTLVYANVSLRKGFYPANSIIKLRQAYQIVNRH